LLSTIANVLALIGLKDADEKAYGIADIVGDTVENFLKSILGASNYQALTDTWKKASTIYTAAVNVWQLTQDSLYALSEGLEVLGRYNARIGNALKRSGEVLENAYDWMSETIDFHARKAKGIKKVIDGLANAQTVASDLQDITSNFREAQENINEIKAQSDLIKQQLSDRETVEKDGQAIKKNNSQSPAINPSDYFKPSTT
jgi:hypothetical protein